MHSTQIIELCLTKYLIQFCDSDALFVGSWRYTTHTNFCCTFCFWLWTWCAFIQSNMCLCL